MCIFWEYISEKGTFFLVLKSVIVLMLNLVISVQNATKVCIAMLLKFLCDPKLIATIVVTYEFVNSVLLVCFVVKKKFFYVV